MAPSPVWHRPVAPSHALPRSATHAHENSFSFPLRLIADDGDATPHPFFRGSEAFRFVCFSRIAFGDFSHTSGAKVFAGRFSEGVSGPNSNRVRISSKLSNSRNCLIITTGLHIVNRCSKHRKKRRKNRVSEF